MDNSLIISESSISRRFSLKSIGTLSAASLFGSSCNSPEKNTQKKFATAFALIGDRFHNSDYTRTALGKTLVRGTGLSIDFTDEVTLLSQETLQHYRLLIIFRDGMLWPEGYVGEYAGFVPGKNGEILSEPPFPKIEEKPVMWMTPEQGRVVKDFVESGGSALFYHNSSHISLSNKDYRDVEGAIYTGHPPVRPFWVRIVNKSHPITQGVNDFLVTDEQHYIKYEKSPDYVLMRSENRDGLSYTGSHGDQGTTCEAGWAYNNGKGKVCFLAPGHTIPALWNPEYVKLQQNAVKWLLGR